MLLRFWLCEECRTVKRHEVSVWTSSPTGKLNVIRRAKCEVLVLATLKLKLLIDATGVDFYM